MVARVVCMCVRREDMWKAFEVGISNFVCIHYFVLIVVG